MVDYLYVQESMRLMIHGAELLGIVSTGDYEAQHKGNDVVLGSFCSQLYLLQSVTSSTG
jgi:hypothetical protein